MKYLETPWEKRNLGVDSCKYIVSRNDSPEEVCREISLCKKEYIEVFVETGEMNIVWSLEKAGFTFVETIFDLVVNKNDLTVPKLYERLLQNVVYAKASDIEVNEILDEIYSGDMFLTDKIALNPRFGRAAAGKRYYLWMKEFREQGIIYSVKYKDKLIGFEAVKLNDDVIDLMLGGILPSATGSGLSPMLQGARAEYWKNEEFSKMYSHASSNNFPVIKTHEAYGFKLDRALYVLVK